MGVESLNFCTMEGWLDNCVSNDHMVDSLQVWYNCTIKK